MRKLSLLLALLLVATCFVLASCGGDETSSEAPATSTATSSEAPADDSSEAPADESSEAPADESSEAPADESSEAPADDSSEPADEPSEDPAPEKNPDAKPTNGENVAVGKTYEISDQFYMGGEEVGWGYDPNGILSYPDNNYELTDGYIPTDGAPDGVDKYNADCWMAFNQNTPAQTERGYGFVKMDLGESYVISEIAITTLKHTAAGINCPYNIEVMVSEDGESYVSAGVLDIQSELDGLANDSVHTLTIELDCTARYLEFRVISYGWAFMGEIEVK